MRWKTQQDDRWLKGHRTRIESIEAYSGLVLTLEKECADCNRLRVRQAVSNCGRKLDESKGQRRRQIRQRM